MRPWRSYALARIPAPSRSKVRTSDGLGVRWLLKLLLLLGLARAEEGYAETLQRRWRFAVGRSGRSGSAQVPTDVSTGVAKARTTGCEHLRATAATNGAPAARCPPPAHPLAFRRAASRACMPNSPAAAAERPGLQSRAKQSLLLPRSLHPRDGQETVAAGAGAGARCIVLWCICVALRCVHPPGTYIRSSGRACSPQPAAAAARSKQQQQ